MTKCLFCNKEAAEYHEIFYGQGKRKICLEYNLKVSLCRDHHIKAHEWKHPFAREICRELNIDYVRVNQILNRNTCDWLENDTKYLAFVRDYLESYFND